MSRLPTSPIRSVMSDVIRETILRGLARRPVSVVHIRFRPRPMQSPVQKPKYRSATCDGKIDPCAICLSDINLHEKVAVLSCHHVFHEDCLEPWFNEHNTCPTCRHQC